MEEHSPGSKVNLSEPTLHILINIYRNLALLSCVRRYNQRRNFSLRLSAEKKDGEVQGGGEAEGKKSEMEEREQEGASTEKSEAAGDEQ